MLRSGVIPANADATSGPVEIWAARTSLHATLYREAPNGLNPAPLTDANLVAGIHVCGDYCAIWHGTAKSGASLSPLAKGFYPHPPQSATHGVEDDPEGVSFWRIKHGIRWTAMSSWQYTLTDQQIWTVVLFLKHMSKLPPRPDDAWGA